MNPSLLLSCLASVSVLATGAGCASSHAGPVAHNVSTKPIASGLAPVHGIQMHYELYGPPGASLAGDLASSVPLVLLHGGGSDIDVSFGRILPFFAAHRLVLGIDEQGHGRSSDRDAPVAFDTSAGDVAALLRHLKIEQADVMGFSNGASVALDLSLQHPELVRRLVFASSFTKRAGARPEFWEAMAKADFSSMPQALKDAFLKSNPDPQKLRTMHDKDLARMQSFPDLPDEALRTIRARTLIVFGDRDIVRPEHGIELTQQIPAARLLILPGGHGDYLGELVMSQEPSRYPELTAGLIEEFLDAP